MKLLLLLSLIFSFNLYAQKAEVEEKELTVAIGIDKTEDIGFKYILKFKLVMNQKSNYY